MEEKRDATFQVLWSYLIWGMLLGFIALIVVSFAKTDRRDKVYSTLLGLSISLVVNLLILYYR